MLQMLGKNRDPLSTHRHHVDRADCVDVCGVCFCDGEDALKQFDIGIWALIVVYMLLLFVYVVEIGK